jgi:uncharacterized membrane protein YeaQ/YmgE (transglycosylase-associated protein family)
VAQPAVAPDTARRVLTAVEFDVLWKRLGLGPTPVVLRLASPGRTHAERHDLQDAGWQALRRRGLAGPSGPEPELVRLLHLMARPAAQLELRGHWEHRVRAVAAGAPGTCVLAVRQDATVTLTAHGCLPAALLRVLPPAPPGPGRASTLPSAVLTAATSGAPGSGLRAGLLAADVPTVEAGLLTRMLSGITAGAQIAALVTDRWGVLRRSGGILAILDAPRGRYLLSRSVGEDGVEWSSVAPTDIRRLSHRITELLAP